MVRNFKVSKKTSIYLIQGVKYTSGFRIRLFTRMHVRLELIAKGCRAFFQLDGQGWKWTQLNRHASVKCDDTYLH